MSIMAEADISAEVAAKLKQVLQSLKAISDDLPGQAKFALGVLTRIANTKPKGAKESVTDSISPDDANPLREALADLQAMLDKEANNANNPRPGSVRELRTMIIELLRALNKFLTQQQQSPQTQNAQGAQQQYHAPAYGYRQSSVGPYPQPFSASRSLRMSAVLKESVEDSEGSEWKVQMIRAGMSANRHNYPKEVLAQALPLFEGVKAYVDHPVKEATERSVKDIAGWFENVQMDDEGVSGKFIVSGAQPWLKEMLIDAYHKDKLDLCGFSIFASGKTKLAREGTGKPFWEVESIDNVRSVDVVAEPAAGGRIKSLAESEQQEVAELDTIAEMTKDDLMKLRPDLVAAIQAEAKKLTPEEEKKKAEEEKEACEEPVAKNKKVKEAKDTVQCPKCEWTGPAAEAKNGKCPECGAKVAAYEKPTKEAKKADEEDEEDKKKMKESLEKFEKLTESMQLRESAAMLRETVSTSGLPKPVQDKIARRYAGKVVAEDILKSDIKEEKETLAKLTESSNGLRSVVREMTSEPDRFKKAMEGMMEGKTIDGVAPFRSLKEAYATVKGFSIADVNPAQLLAESRGFDSGFILRESVTTASWAEILGDSITRKLIKEYSLPALNEWKQLVSLTSPLQDFRTQRRPRLGGYGTLPTVAEGGTYQPLTSPTDEEVTYVPAKYGGLEDLTIETIANDDLGRVRQIPILLARAAKVTLYRYVFTLITANPTQPDTFSLISTDHANLGSTALSSAQLTVAKRQMRSQTAYGTTTEFLQIKPKFLLVPNELEQTAWLLANADRNPDEVLLATGGTAIGSGATALSSNPNIHRGTVTPIVVDFWTDADNWYLIADPTYCPTIELGFLSGKEEPELFTQDQQTVGSVFTADKISYKIRHIYGGVCLDWRSFWGAIF